MKKNKDQQQTITPAEPEQQENAGKILDSLAGNVDEVEKELEGEQEAESAVFDPSARMIKNRKAFFVVGLIII
ncbi:MAG: hypothetical protein K2K41_09740, partial [Ruminiclostridium sp.]|nr:hypothetical protein [Ruminiclostridium sp.]